MCLDFRGVAEQFEQAASVIRQTAEKLANQCEEGAKNLRALNPSEESDAAGTEQNADRDPEAPR